MDLTERQKEIAIILIECAKARKTICFSDLMFRVHTGRSKIGKELSAVGRKCKELSLPILTVLVVYKGSNRTGYGFIDEFVPEERGKGRDREVWESNKKEVFGCRDWGSLINYASRDFDLDLVDDITVTEGAVQKYISTYRTRSVLLREECIRKKGSKCIICGFDAAKVYGDTFINKIHVHHDKVLNKGEIKSTVDDLYPVCPNCHMILHSNSGKEPFTISEVRNFIEEQKKIDK